LIEPLRRSEHTYGFCKQTLNWAHELARRDSTDRISARHASRLLKKRRRLNARWITRSEAAPLNDQVPTWTSGKLAQIPDGDRHDQAFQAL
jgi:hypothetical protein